MIHAVEKALAENKKELAELSNKEQIEIARFTEQVLDSLGVKYASEEQE